MSSAEKPVSAASSSTVVRAPMRRPARLSQVREVRGPEGGAGGEPCGQEVVIVGAGSVGLEAAIDLKRAGKDVTVIELLSNYSSLQKSASAAAGEFRALIDELKIDVRLGHRLLEVTDDAVICETTETGEKVTIPAGSVLLAVGVKCRWKEADALRRCCPETSAFLVGDCLNVGSNVKAATSGALLAAAYI